MLIETLFALQVKVVPGEFAPLLYLPSVTTVSLLLHENPVSPNLLNANSVSYTHLTLPTILLV